MTDFTKVWVYLSASPLLFLTLTLAAFQAGSWIYERSGHKPFLNPVMTAVILLVAILTLTQTPYPAYFEGAQFVHFLLGPATVALAIPLYRQFERVRRSAVALLTSILCGSLTAIGTAVGLGWLLGASRDTLLALAPKSVTAPVAMGITEQLGGLPSLTAVLVILTGILGAVIGPMVLNLLRVRDWRARGLALGTASHGIGTARALQVNELAGAFSGLAMGLNALATAILLPVLWRVFF
ncbi:putative effector of murein hydrolase [Hoeflea phototrophica DFL-43]|uniref:Putative effector of murein hydrolase n=1 Tax=Hoeflea phototrophica (strain DSM 17068 / NCIMB 14078 / DFL-43) TaxID=411684 RepID=A9D8Z8_HOEPD|nr:LrgB family protein [Hoeflea phototrophica]EDQ32821.1 putative effector of murein hydrolase [Hoeflea phototrophica DFL-43]